MLEHTRYVAGLLSVVGVIMTAACAGTKPPSAHHFYENFETAAASVADGPYTVYWLGPELSLAGGGKLIPDFGDFGDDATTQRFSYSYDGDPGAFISIEIYTPASWSVIRQRRLTSARVEPMTTERASVAGGAAEIWLLTRRTEMRTNHIQVAVDFGDTIVVCSTTSLPQPDRNATPDDSLSGFATRIHTPSPTPLPDLNPLIDEQAFLAVLQGLRPYPQ